MIIKKAIICKNIHNYKINRKIKKTYLPKSGDVAIFEVLSIGKHKAIQGEKGNNTYLFPGDKIMCTFGTRYASAQFEGYVPERFYSRYQILGQGGVVGVLESFHQKFKDVGATEVKLVGYAVDENNEVINTIYHDTEQVSFSDFKKSKDYKIYLSLGASMDSGKTTTAAFLSRGFMKEKKTVGFIKLTGTVYSKDCSFVRDCGAKTAVDFSYCGYPSTYLNSTEEIMNILATLLKRVERVNPDIVVIEIADGLLQRETNALINHKPLMKIIDEVLLSCADSLSVATGIDILSKTGFKPIVLTGMFTASPLMIKEVKAFSDIPVFTLDDYMDKPTFKNTFF